MPHELVTVPCLADNYAFLVHDTETGRTTLFDAPEAAAIERALTARGWTLDEIAITHHHGDHVGGEPALRAAHEARVIGAAADAHRLPRLDLAVEGGDEIELCGTTARVIAVPGHTSGHIAFHLPEVGAVFTGDSLMALGCGRLFEGTAQQMWDSLSRLAALPPETLVCSGHEYTESNARFALTIEPHNPDLKARARAVAEARSRGEATVPSRLGEEQATNPFLRARLPDVKEAIHMPGASDAEAFAEIRRRKDAF